MWGNKWTFTSRLKTLLTGSISLLIPQQEVGSETPKVSRGHPFVSAGGLRSRPELQTVAGLGPERVDSCAGPRNLNETAGDRRVVVIVSGPGAQLASRTG